jgi:uncharacterized protein involved in response to NO
MLVMLIGGRIVPSFTHNWIVRINPGRVPRPFSRFDAASLAFGAAALLTWIAAPRSAASGMLLIVAGILQAVRLARWAGDRTLADRLVFVLHVAYAFVPLGFLLTGAAVLWPDAVPPSAGIHAWSAGALGMMTLGVMTRASLGHTGRALVASAATQAIYLAAFLATVLRIVAAFAPSIMMLQVAGLFWIAAYAGFVAAYGPLLLRARAK